MSNTLSLHDALPISSSTGKRALYYFADSKSDVLILWPQSAASDKTAITISKN